MPDLTIVDGFARIYFVIKYVWTHLEQNISLFSMDLIKFATKTCMIGTPSGAEYIVMCKGSAKACYEYHVQTEARELEKKIILDRFVFTFLFSVCVCFGRGMCALRETTYVPSSGLKTIYIYTYTPHDVFPLLAA